MRAVVHIGLPKTGTTSIQGWLQRNASRLPERGAAYDRIHYPGKTWRRAQVEIAICQMDRAGRLFPKEHGQTRKVFGLTDLRAQASVAAAYTETFREAVGAHPDATWVFSCEDLGTLSRTPELVRALDDWMGQFFSDIRYLCYIRRQEDRLLSRYSQVLRQGSTQTLDGFLRNASGWDYFELAQTWVNGVGRDRFSLRLLEPDALAGGDLVADFAQAIGIDPSGLPVPPRANEALSVGVAEFLRRANICLKERGIRRRPDVEKRLREVEKTLMNSAVSDRRLALSAAQVDQIRRANAQSNEKLRAAFFPERDALFPPTSAASCSKSEGGTDATQDMADIALQLAFGDLDGFGVAPAGSVSGKARAVQNSGENGSTHRRREQVLQ
ncbi:hypothetical protein [Tropicimonas marinistellae]|uniref:hypothetical protein n=1 Tax=Tropicimonas marinistellae TaxID=1739787 RepID=UPI000837320A|nr:hypothetical protein [Tropicimonas marinistellae]